jgi:uncharacterized DUF497 family protein
MREELARLAQCSGFQWDEGNSEKNWEKHQVSRLESEQALSNRPLRVAVDEQHSQREPRFYALGQTDAGRRLFLVFTVRVNLIRVITARDMSRRERKVYEREQQEKEDTEVQE